MNKHDFVGHQILLGLYKLQNGRCAYCGGRMIHPDEPVPEGRWRERCTRDHLTPLARGGRDDENNRVAACQRCNKLKGNLDAATFVRVRHNLVMLLEARKRDCGDVDPRWIKEVSNTYAGR